MTAAVAERVSSKSVPNVQNGRLLRVQEKFGVRAVSMTPLGCGVYSHSTSGTIVSFMPVSAMASTSSLFRALTGATVTFMVTLFSGCVKRQMELMSGGVCPPGLGKYPY